MTSSTAPGSCDSPARPGRKTLSRSGEGFGDRPRPLDQGVGNSVDARNFQGGVDPQTPVHRPDQLVGCDGTVDRLTGLRIAGPDDGPAASPSAGQHRTPDARPVI